MTAVLISSTPTVVTINPNSSIVTTSQDSNIVIDSGDSTIVPLSSSGTLVVEREVGTIITSGQIGPPGPQGQPGVSGGEEDMPYAKRVDFISDTEFYKGEATVGEITSAASWRIQKTVLGNDGDVTVTWADGNSNFDNIWDNRLSLPYS